jgi:hypothetical protein
MNMIPDDTTPPELSARLLRLREAAAVLQPPPALESQLSARLFATASDASSTHAPREAADVVAASVSAAAKVPAKPERRTASRLERWAAWIAWPVSVTATAGLVSWMVYTNPAIAPDADIAAASAARARAVAHGDAAAGRDAATPFLALGSLDDIPAGGLRGELVSATLPRATLAEFGLPVSPMRAAEPINAEFLVGANGGVLAVRFVDGAAR